MRLRWLFLACALAVSGCVVTARVHAEAVTDEAPPAPRDEDVAPRSGWVWVDGHWERRHHAWTWKDGHWQRARPGYVWRQGMWIPRKGRYHWVDGGWEPSSSPRDHRSQP